jgi:4-cresol dehydrogenase (hydroxylating)
MSAELQWPPENFNLHIDWQLIESQMSKLLIHSLTTAKNVSANDVPSTAICAPETHEDVVDLVQQARKDGIPLYPISTGFNWGYGSASPVVEGCKLVDLRKMRKILNQRGPSAISPSNPVALIEPGVTQGDLYDFLREKHFPLTFNVTGSSRDTSLIGNALDRGVGYFGPRREDLFALKLVLGTGQTLHTGFRRLGENSPLAYSHPYGLGPMADGLFFQGNFGIVTSACFRLMPRRPKEVAVSLALHDHTKLGEFIDELVQLKREGLMTSVTHLANKARSQASLLYGMTDYLEKECGFSLQHAEQEAQDAMRIAAPNEWTSLAAVTGTPAQVSATLQEIRKRVKKLARLVVVGQTLLDIGFKICNTLRFIPKLRANAAVINAVRPLHGLALGVPTDAAIDNLMWKYGRGGQAATTLDQSNCGLLYISPALPANGRQVASLMQELEQIAKEHNHQLFITINMETPTSLVAIMNLLFNRSNAGEVTGAHVCAKVLLEHIRARGLEVYRARTDMMSDIASEDSDYWQTIRGIKRQLDPQNIIAPGRYNLP